MKCIKESIGHGVSSDSRYFISVENSANTTTVCNNLHSSGCLQFWNLLHFRCCLLKLLFYKSDADQELLSLCKGLLFYLFDCLILCPTSSKVSEQLIQDYNITKTDAIQT